MVNLDDGEIPTHYSQNADALLARRAFEAQRRLDDEGDAVRPHARRERLPLVDAEREAKVRHRDLDAHTLLDTDVYLHRPKIKLSQRLAKVVRRSRSLKVSAKHWTTARCETLGGATSSPSTGL